jgi:hypothetical protein
MKKSLAAFVVLLVLGVTPAAASAASACQSGQCAHAHAASLYEIPSAPPATPAAAAHVSASDVVGELSALTPGALAAKGGIALQAAASGPGALTVTVTAKIHGKTIVLGSGHQTASAAGSVVVKLTLTRAGKTALASHKGQLKVTVSVVFRAKQAGKRTARATGTLK